MLIVETTIGNSNIHGTGIFAEEDIKEGQIIWALHKSFDPTFSKEEYELLPAASKQYCKFYMYWSDALKVYVMCLDNARHFNHSNDANTTSRWLSPEEARKQAKLTDEQWDQILFEEGFTVATRDIKKGEEITSNYLTDFKDNGGVEMYDWISK